MANPDDADATKILDNSSSEGKYFNFDKAETGIVFLKNESASAGDTVELYGSYGDHSEDFFVKQYTNSDVGGDNSTLVDAFQPVPPYVKVKPTTGNWTVIVDSDW